MIPPGCRRHPAAVRHGVRSAVARRPRPATGRGGRAAGALRRGDRRTGRGAGPTAGGPVPEHSGRRQEARHASHALLGTRMIEQHALRRFSPTRAGIINLWDYRDEEFVFVDGWLVLRGPNGSGKTKALEVLFPFVLDGRIEPRRLNPFASEDRTMKSNLLYRGQESTYSYVWLEFAAEGTEFVTVGVGLRAQRHNDRFARWYFVVDGRVGVDFSLLGPDDRPLTRKQLIAELGADAITDKPVDHRAAIDTRLFGLGAERYEQLLTLVLTLRRPQLAKHLDPKGLSRTLSDGLRPLDESLIIEAARSFDDMESVQRTLNGLVAADDAARTFLSSYVTYLRTHARAAADVAGERLATVEHNRAALAAALVRHRESVRLAEEAETAVG